MARAPTRPSPSRRACAGSGVDGDTSAGPRRRTANAARNVFGVEQLVRAGFDRTHQLRQHGRERLGLDAAPVHAMRRAVVVEAGELPVAEPVDGPEQPPLLQTLWRRSVRREALLAERV